MLVALGNGLLDGSGGMGAHAVMAQVPPSSNTATPATTDSGPSDSTVNAQAAAATADVPDSVADQKEAVATSPPPPAAIKPNSETADPEAARSAFQRAVKLLPDHVGALHGLGAACWVLGEYREADQAWRQAVGAYDADAARVNLNRIPVVEVVVVVASTISLSLNNNSQINPLSLSSFFICMPCLFVCLPH